MTDEAQLALQIGAGIAAGIGVHCFVPVLRNDLPAATLFAGFVSAGMMLVVFLIVYGMTSTISIGLLFSFGIGLVAAFPVLLLCRLFLMLRRRG